MNNYDLKSTLKKKEKWFFKTLLATGFSRQIGKLNNCQESKS